jgi:hypothetical protein
MQMSSRNHKLNNSYGVLDFYKYYKKNSDNPVDLKIYRKILDKYNKKVSESILKKGLDFIMPYLNFEITIRKDKRKPKIIDGKVINNTPVDPVATKKLWEKDKEAKEKKILVRYNNSHTSGYVFRIYCKKFRSNLKNKNLFKFRPVRKLKRDLAKLIKDPDVKFDSFLLYKNK